MRLTLADAGDSNDDANFEQKTANATVLRLTKELAWVEEHLAAESSMRTAELNLADRIFKNAISVCAHAAKAAYDRMLMREALKCAWCVFTSFPAE